MIKFKYKVLIITILSIIINAGIVRANNLFTYQITQDGSNLEVTFIMNSEKSDDSKSCNNFCSWDYGDNNTEMSIEKEYFTHVYDLNDASLISNGYFNVEVYLEYTIWGIPVSSLDCEQLYTVVQTKTISYYIGEADLSVDFFIEPEYRVYAKGDPFDLYFKITPNNSTNTNNLKYALENHFTGKVISDFIAQSDLYSNIKIAQYTPPEIGIYLFYLNIYQNDDLLKSKLLQIDVAEVAANPGNNNCSCIDGFNPSIGVEVTVNDDDVDFAITDNSSTGFQQEYRPCSHLLISYKGCHNPLTLYDFDYSVFEYTKTSCSRPGIFENPRLHSFKMKVSCDYPENPDDGFILDIKNVIVQPIKLPEDVYVAANGESKVIKTLTWSPCVAYEIFSTNKPDDDFNWLTDVKWNLSKMEFTCAPNFTENDREFDIRLHFNTSHENSYSIVNGERVHYRTVHVVQPTMLTNFQEVSDNLIEIPDFDYPEGTSYFSITGASGTVYFYDPSVISMEALLDALDPESGEITINSFNKNGDIIWSQSFSVKHVKCTWWIFNKTEAQNYDIYIHGQSRISNGFSVTNFAVEPNKTLILTAHKNDYIRLGVGFHAKKGSNFNAKLQSCLETKSMADTTQMEPISETVTNPNNTEISLEPISERSIKVYPNPTNGIFSIDISSIEREIKYIQVYDISGSIIHSTKNGFENNEQIDLTKYPAGVYIIKILAGEEYYFNKIIKQ